MTLISVLIPIYNGEKHINKCIESIINQTYKNIEIICINDGSTDNTKEILENFQKKDKRIKIINKKNSGYGSSLNLGIEKAKGKYITIIESDDNIKNTMLETLLNKMEENDVDIVKANFYKVSNTIKKNTSKYFINKITNINLFPQMLLIQPSIWSAIYKKEFLTKNNIKFKETKDASYQDTSFHFKTMFLAKNILLLDEPLYYYTINNSNSSINSKNKAFAIFNEIEEINNFIKDKNINKNLLTIKNIFEYKTIIWNFDRIQNKYNKKVFNKALKYFKLYNYKVLIKNKSLTKKDKLYLSILNKNKKLFYAILILRKQIKSWKTILKQFAFLQVHQKI